jgi:hypothetical protein
MSRVAWCAALCLALPLCVSADGGRELTEAERSALLRQANELGRGASVRDASIQIGQGQSLSGLAVVVYGATEAGEHSCIAPQFEFSGHGTGGEVVQWEVLPDSLTYLYWPNRASCQGPLTGGYIGLKNLIDTDTLDRLLAARQGVLEQVIEKLDGRNVERIRGATLGGIGVEYERLTKRFVYNLSYSVSQCYAFDAHVRIRDRIEVVDVVEILC